MRAFVCTLVAASVVLGLSVGPAQGLLVFRKEFEAKYKVNDPETETEKALATAAQEAQCFVCHVKGKTKEFHNPYGESLEEFLDKDDYTIRRRISEPEKVKQEIWDALEKVEAKASPEGVTYGELLEQGKLPAGTP